MIGQADKGSILYIETVKEVVSGRSTRYVPDNIFGSTNKITVQYNPENMSYSLGQKIAENKTVGSNETVQTPTGKKEDKISFSLLFDTSLTKDQKGGYISVKEKHVKNFELLVSNDDLGQVPICIVTWGSIISFTGTLENLKISYTMFSPDGKPLRVRMDLTFTRKNVASVSYPPNVALPEKVRVRKLNPGEYIGMLALLEYGDVNKWKGIAAANNIDNPRLIPPGIDIAVTL